MKRQNSGDLSDQPTKKQKIIIENDSDLILVDAYSTSLSLIPYDIVYNHIVPHYSRTWLYVSKKCSQIAFRHLLEDSRIEQYITTARLNDSAHLGHLRVIRLLVKSKHVSIFDDTTLDAALEGNQYAIVKLLVKLSAISSQSIDDIFHWAAIKGHVELAKKLFNDERFSGDTLCNTFGGISELALVQFLLTKRERIDNDTISTAAITAARNGHYSKLQLLIREGADPSVESNEAIRIATRDGKYAIVKLLLEHPNVDPTDNTSLPQFNDDCECLGSAIQEAFKQKNYSLLHLFLKDERATKELQKIK